MKIKEIEIHNFRKLKNIKFGCKDSINTIVGPNGVGKSSIIDAIRIVKAVLLPTNDNEAMSTLQQMGVFSPQTGAFLFETICSDTSKETTIEIFFEINRDEISRLKEDLPAFVNQRLLNQLGQVGLQRLQLVQFLSTPVGIQRQNEILKETEQLLREFEKTLTAKIKLIVNGAQISGQNGFDQELVAYLLRSPVFSDTMFTVFPADRSFPTGDANIQLGQTEIGNQLQSYSIQPQLKFARLKAAIISYLMLNSNKIEPIKEDFALIFNNLIPGKELEGINLEPRIGRLSVLIKETQNGRIYDIDFLSSGEKGLLLTFFLLLRTVRDQGIILLDEPELHLNPAVCRRIIPFLKEFICLKKNAQIILTTHSAEILADTKEDESSLLLHLINEETISPIFKRDNEEAQEAIKSLGISASDLLFNKGVIYLEGVIDEEYVEEILKGSVDGFKVQSLGGRSSVESEILTLQEADAKGKLNGYHVFILDHDNKPTTLKDSKNVRIIQWDRYCLENYFLEIMCLYDVVRDFHPKNFPSSRADFNKDLQAMAISQIPNIAIYKVLERETPQGIGINKRDIRDKSPEEIAKLASYKMVELVTSLSHFEEGKWQDEFANKVKGEIAKIEEEWRQEWMVKCNGKDLLLSLNLKYGIGNYKQFVKKLIANNRSEGTNSWKELTQRIKPILAAQSAR